MVVRANYNYIINHLRNVKKVSFSHLKVNAAYITYILFFEIWYHWQFLVH